MKDIEGKSGLDEVVAACRKICCTQGQERQEGGHTEDIEGKSGLDEVVAACRKICCTEEQES